MWEQLEQHIDAVIERYPHPWRPTTRSRASAQVAFSGGGVWKGICPAGVLALRCWPAGYDPRRVAAIHRLLEMAQPRGCRVVPQPIADLHGQTFHCLRDRLWELCTWMPGEPVRSTPSEAQLHAAMQALAHWHACVTPVDFGNAVELFGPATRQAASPSFCRRISEWHRLRSAWDRLSADAVNKLRPAVDPASLTSRTLRAVERLAPRIEEWLATPHTASMRVCLRDVHREHVLFTGAAVTGLVDFGAVGIDAVACDLGRLLGSLVPDDDERWQAALAYYRQFGTLSTQAEPLARAFDATGVAIGALHWLEWLAIDERTFTDRTAAYRRWEQLVLRLEHWLERENTPRMVPRFSVGVSGPDDTL